MKFLGFASRFLALLAKTPPGYLEREDLSHANPLAIPHLHDCKEVPKSSNNFYHRL
jgi:hypothetical protein